MDINSIMSGQLAQLQQTLQLSILDQSMNNGAANVVKMLEDMPQQAPASHPYKGQVIDVQA